MPTIYLETWLHQMVRNQVKSDPDHFRLTGGHGPGRITRSDVEAFQFHKLRQTLLYAYDKSTFYHELFDKSGIKPEDVRTRDDLSKLPFTEPRHLAETPYRFLCLSQTEVARAYTFTTSGTTGPQKKVFCTQGDIDRMVDFMAAGMGTVATAKDVVQILLPDGRPNSQADLLSKGVRKLGATPIVASVDLSAEGQLELIEKSHSTVVFGRTGRLFRITKELQPKHELSTKGVKVLFVTSEYLPEAMRRELQDAWNCRVHSHYGMTEMGLGVAVECQARNGYHFNEADLLLEVINPRTGEVLQPGEEGELVFTTLSREATPLIRYRTHDLSRLVTEPCSCGATTLLKIDKVKKRLESMVTIGDDDQIYPTLFDDLLFEIPGLIDYQVTLSRKGNKDCLSFKVEVAQDGRDLVPEVARKLLAVPLIERNVASGRMAEPAVEVVGWGTLAPVSRAKKLIIDKRASCKKRQ